mmetsp:Transcript_91247/g.258407  ORF Transcript_91247/g.258407 Transcript_91247/m.258407 type:complete len:483 (+) Transcript_91247:585-2033(+)
MPLAWRNSHASSRRPPPQPPSVVLQSSRYWGDSTSSSSAPSLALWVRLARSTAMQKRSDITPAAATAQQEPHGPWLRAVRIDAHAFQCRRASKCLGGGVLTPADAWHGSRLVEVPHCRISGSCSGRKCVPNESTMSDTNVLRQCGYETALHEPLASSLMRFRRVSSFSLTRISVRFAVRLVRSTQAPPADWRSGVKAGESARGSRTSRRTLSWTARKSSLRLPATRPTRWLALTARSCPPASTQKAALSAISREAVVPLWSVWSSCCETPLFSASAARTPSCSCGTFSTEVRVNAQTVHKCPETSSRTPVCFVAWYTCKGTLSASPTAFENASAASLPALGSSCGSARSKAKHTSLSKKGSASVRTPRLMSMTTLLRRPWCPVGASASMAMARRFGSRATRSSVTRAGPPAALRSVRTVASKARRSGGGRRLPERTAKADGARQPNRSQTRHWTRSAMPSGAGGPNSLVSQQGQQVTTAGCR